MKILRAMCAAATALCCAFIRDIRQHHQLMGKASPDPAAKRALLTAMQELPWRAELAQQGEFVEARKFHEAEICRMFGVREYQLGSHAESK